MGLFKKKHKRVDPEKLNEMMKQKDDQGDDEKEENPAKGAGSAGGVNLEAEFTKINARIQSLSEQQKVAGERFSRVNEQIGELRQMVLESDKKFQTLEVKALKAVDLVDTVQPDKLMIEIQKQDGKVEALRASIEGNEIIMKNMTEELREIRKKLQFFKGIDQVTKMYDEVKEELSEIKKTEASVQRHADKVETIFGEFQKTFQEFNQYSDRLKGVEKNLQQNSKNIDEAKVKAIEAAKKADLDKLVKKVDDFEKHASKAVELINKRGSQDTAELRKRFKDMEKKMTEMFNKRFEESKKAVEIFRTLEKRAPEIAKQLGTDKVKVENAEVPVESTPEQKDEGKK